MNVQSEVLNIKSITDEGRYSISEISPLFSDDPLYKDNNLQQFINKVVTYAELRVGTQEEVSFNNNMH